MESITELHQTLVKLLSESTDTNTKDNLALRSGFTIADLQTILGNADPRFLALNYKQFRNLLYDKPTNNELAKHGNRIVVLENNGHIDRNIYHLESIDY